MSMKEVSGHVLNIGDHVRMNLEVLGKGDLDGVEFTSSGVNYWRYMNTHPEEIYTVTNIDEDADPNGICIYSLSGAMSENTWAADELIFVPEAKTVFEVIKNMTLEEMSSAIGPMLESLFQTGVPADEAIREFLLSCPTQIQDTKKEKKCNEEGI